MKAKTRVPKARIIRPVGRCFQVVYDDPVTGKRVKRSVGSRSERDAQQTLTEVQAKL